MTRRAVVIRTVGDAEIAGAIVDGMSQRVYQLDWGELTAVRAELARLRARTDVRKYREDRDWHLVQAELQERYAIRPHGAFYNHVLLAYTISYMFFKECFRRLLRRSGRARRWWRG